MMLSDLIALRIQLAAEPLPSEPDTIVAVRLPGESRYHLGLNSDGLLCALVEVQDPGGGVDVRLRNLQVRQGVHCRVRAPYAPDQVVTGSLVICRAEQSNLVDLFLRLYGDAVDSLGPAPSADEVSSWVQRLASLFSRLENEGRKRLQGLWAELLVLREFGDPLLMLRRWRPDPTECFDFLAGRFAVEVKSCRDFERVHEFSLDQLRPPQGLVVWIASVVVRSDPAGTTVLGLLAELEASIADPAARQLLRDIAFTTAGSALEEDEHHRFDAEIARASLRLLDVEAIPSIDGEIPPAVLSVSLRCRCDGVPEIGTSSQAVARLC